MEVYEVGDPRGTSRWELTALFIFLNLFFVLVFLLLLAGPRGEGEVAVNKKNFGGIWNCTEVQPDDNCICKCHSSACSCTFYIPARQCYFKQWPSGAA